MAKAKHGGGQALGSVQANQGRRKARGLLLFKATAGFSYKMADGYVGHFVTPLEDKGL